VDFIVATLILANAAAIMLWISGAIYFDVCGGGRWGWLLVAAWAGGVIVLFAVWQPLWQPFLVFLCVTAIFLVWWFRQKPSHDRDWVPSSAVLPRAMRDGDMITIDNVRNFDYRSLEDFTPRYEARAYHLANLNGVDVIFFVWENPLLGHPALVFDFGSDGRLCMSIEMRYRKGQDYSLLRGLYRQQELIFLAADERDVILRRTKYRMPIFTASSSAQSNCGPCSSTMSKRSTICSRSLAGTTSCARTVPRRSTGFPAFRTALTGG